jgi:hypothetical protein
VNLFIALVQWPVSQMKMTFQEIRIIATGPGIANQLRDVNTICRRSWYIAAHIWKIVYISQLIRYARASSNYSDFLKRHLYLRNRLLDQGYAKIRLVRRKPRTCRKSLTNFITVKIRSKIMYTQIEILVI